MNIETKLTLVGAGSILLFDTVAALLSVHFHFSYTSCVPASLAVYVGLAYWAARYLKLRGTLAFGAFLGLVDATLGWKLSSLLGAAGDYPLQKITVGVWCSTAIFVMALGAVMALIAFLLAARRTKRENR